MVAVLVYSPTDIEAVGGIAVLVIVIGVLGDGEICLVIPAVVAVAEGRGAVELDVAWCAHVQRTTDNNSFESYRVSVATEIERVGIVGLLVELVGQHGTCFHLFFPVLVRVFQCPGYGVTLVVVRVVIGHLGIPLGRTQPVVRTGQFVPRFLRIGYAVAVQVLAYLYGTRFRPYAVDVGYE